MVILGISFLNFQKRDEFIPSSPEETKTQCTGLNPCGNPPPD